jgi:hypothetical protein
MVEAFGPRAEVMSRFAPRAGAAGQQVRQGQNVIPLTLPNIGGDEPAPGGTP